MISLKWCLLTYLPFYPYTKCSPSTLGFLSTCAMFPDPCNSWRKSLQNLILDVIMRLNIGFSFLANATRVWYRFFFFFQKCSLLQTDFVSSRCHTARFDSSANNRWMTQEQRQLFLFYITWQLGITCIWKEDDLLCPVGLCIWLDGFHGPACNVDKHLGFLRSETGFALYRTDLFLHFCQPSLMWLWWTKHWKDA